jgi:hypothetical protein
MIHVESFSPFSTALAAQLPDKSKLPEAFACPRARQLGRQHGSLLNTRTRSAICHQQSIIFAQSNDHPVSCGGPVACY